MHSYWFEFSQVAVAHLLAVASPGPDFAIVLKQSLVHGRRTAIWTSLGVGTAILLHVTYSLLGIGLLIRSSPFWFTVVKYIGAAYIAWLGVQALQARPRNPAAGGTEPAGRPVPREHSAFATGFLTNALNPKATLFFLSLFILVISPQTPKLVQVGYGLWMAVATAAWFCMVSVVFTHADVRGRFLRYGHWIDWTLGVVFLAIAASLALTTLR
jgi:RhtB (resistance to homoserine/threonine) family protein